MKNRKVDRSSPMTFAAKRVYKACASECPRERRMSTAIFDISTSLDGSTAVKLPRNAINSETDEVIE